MGIVNKKDEDEDVSIIEFEKVIICQTENKIIKFLKFKHLRQFRNIMSQKFIIVLKISIVWFIKVNLVNNFNIFISTAPLKR